MCDLLACLLIGVCSAPLRVVPLDKLHHASGREHLSVVLHVHYQVIHKQNPFGPCLPERAPSLLPTKPHDGLLLTIPVPKRPSLLLAGKGCCTEPLSLSFIVYCILFLIDSSYRTAPRQRSLLAHHHHPAV